MISRFSNLTVNIKVELLYLSFINLLLQFFTFYKVLLIALYYL